MKVIGFFLFATILGCQMPHKNVWRIISRADMPSRLVSIEMDENGWSVEGKKCSDFAALDSVFSTSKGQPALIKISKMAFVSDVELDAVVRSLNRSGPRRVFYDQARGSIDSVSKILEFVP
jgi:hypothetical protein